MRNAWITTEGAAATRALNQDIGDVHAPSLRQRRIPNVTNDASLTPRSVVHQRDLGEVAPSLVVYHEHTNVVSQPDLSGSTHRSLPHTDSATMTAPDVSTDTVPSPVKPDLLGAPRSQTSFDRSAQIRPCSSRAWEESTFPPVLEGSHDDVFSAPTPDHHDTSTTATAMSTTDTVPSDPGPGSPLRPKSGPPSDVPLPRTPLADPADLKKLARPRFLSPPYPRRPVRPRFPSSSDEEDNAASQPRRRRSSGSNYSREHRADPSDSHWYPKRQLWNRLLAILGWGSILSVLTMVAYISLLSTCPSATADRFALRNSYGTVENRYHLTAYDCSDPTEVQAYSSVPAKPCNIRTTPVQQERPTRFQLLQKEQRRYITAHSCFLFRTDLRYNCGVYWHPELDPYTGLSPCQRRISFEQCLTWIWTRTYKPSVYSTMMHGRNLSYPISLNEPTHVSYMVHGRTYTKAPSLPTGHVYETACQGEWFEYVKDQPLNHMVTYYDELHLQTTSLMIEDGTVVDQNRQLLLPCLWEAGRCIAEGKTYIWNLTEPD